MGTSHGAPPPDPVVEVPVAEPEPVVEVPVAEPEPAPEVVEDEEEDVPVARSAALIEESLNATYGKATSPELD
jgi:hypothetical protein